MEENKQKTNINWFPGHMAKTRRMISDNLKLVDVVCELVDARLPLASRNPEIDKIVGSKPRILVMNKADISDPAANEKWISYFASKGIKAVAADSLSGKGLNKFSQALDSVLKEKTERDKKRGIVKSSVKMMIVGIPNVGKSSLINRLSGKSAAKVGNRPGITQTKQWIKLAGKYELLDTPGILWPKFEDADTAHKIAFTGGIKDEILDIEELSCFLIKYLRKNYLFPLCARYKITEETNDLTDFEFLELIGKKRGALISGGEIDTFKAAGFLLDDFRSAKLGRISLEVPGGEKL